MAKNQAPPATQAKDIVVDLLVIGSGTGMAAALTANELGLSTLIVEKTQYVGGSTARSGGAFWMPANPILAKAGAGDTVERAKTYVRSVVGDTAPAQRGEAFVDNGAATVDMLYRTTPMKFFWAKEYSDYHPELPGGSAAGRTCECLPFDASVLGAERGRLRPGLMEAGLPMPVTGADYKWMNLMVKKPSKAFPRIIRRLAQGVYGKYVLKREYIAGGQALAAGLFAGVVQAGIPVWTETSLVRLITEDGRVTGAVVVQDGREVTVTARRGVVLAAGGFDHNMEWRHKYQSESLGEHESLGAEGNTGEAIEAAQELGAGIGSMDQSWWFPAVASIKGRPPMVMLAERALPGSFIVDQTGRRFVNEATDYMSFGQRVLEREKAGDRPSRCGLFSTRSTATATCSQAVSSLVSRFRRHSSTPASRTRRAVRSSLPARSVFPRRLLPSPSRSSTRPLLPVAMRNLVAAEVHTIGTTATRRCPRTRT